MVTVKELLEDPQIQPQHDVICTKCHYIPFHSQKDNTIAWKWEVPHKLSVASTPPSNDSPDLNIELNTYKDKLAPELNNFKKQLETHSKIEVECMKQNLNLNMN